MNYKVKLNNYLSNDTLLIFKINVKKINLIIWQKKINKN